MGIDPCIRTARPEELEPLAQLWFDAWRDGHAHVVPPELVRARTLDNFRGRLQRMLPTVRVATGNDQLLGFFFLKQDELEQLFVAANAKGTGVARALIAAAERELVTNGIRVAWLACAIGNDRAARFYQKQGWRCAGVVTSRLDLDGREFLLDVWRFEKHLITAV